MSSNFNYINNGENCSSRGNCTISPEAASLHELIMYHIIHACHYINMLEKFNLVNYKITHEIIDIIASLIYINEYSDTQLYDIALKSYYIFINSKNRYVAECLENNLVPEHIPDLVTFDNNFSQSEAILYGDLLTRHLNSSVSSENRKFIQILYIVLKSVCQNISNLFDMNVKLNSEIRFVISSLSVLNVIYDDKTLLVKLLSSLADLDSKLSLKISDTLLCKFGNISDVTVSHSTRRGKCILVSGSNFSELYEILKITKDLNIDIYTHSNLLLSHCLDAFKEFPHLIGHYGNNTENCIVDYGTFPGAILLTKNSKNNTEYLYRGRIFSNDYVTPIGVIKIENNNYEPLIESANKSVGFKKGRQKPDTFLGFDESDLDKLIEKLYARFESNKLSRLFIIGMNSFSEVQKEYFDVFFSNIKQDEFVISFYYKSEKNNVVTLDIANYVPLANYVLSKILADKKYISRIHFLFPTCDISSVSAIISLKNFGAGNFYMTTCSSQIINPVVFDLLRVQYSINLLTNPVDNLKNIRKNTSQF